MNSDIIEIENLSKKYNDIFAVNDISFTIKKGEFFGFLGPNGSGKTTTISMLVGILKPSKGLARLKGFDIFKNRNKIKQYIGVAPQENTIFQRKLTIFQYFKLFGRVRGIWGNQLNSRIDDIIISLDLEESLNKYFHQLSGGQKKRVSIGTAILHKPDILFVDEPSLGVDPIGRKKIATILKELNMNGTTIFMTTNYIEEAENLCDRVGILKKGKLIACETPNELKQRLPILKSIKISGKSILAKLKSNKNYAEICTCITEENNNHFILESNNTVDLINQIFTFLKNENLDIDNIQILDKPLEDVFINLAK